MRTIRDLPEWTLPMYAAAWQLHDELIKEPPLCRADIVTVDEQMARDDARTALAIIYDFAVGEPAQRGRMGGDGAIRRHVVRSQCLREMRVRWAAGWRDTPAQEKAFNRACRTMGWGQHGTGVKVTVTAEQARAAGENPRGHERVKVPGAALTDARVAQLEAYLFGIGDSDDDPGPSPAPLGPSSPPAGEGAEGAEGPGTGVSGAAEGNSTHSSGPAAEMLPPLSVSGPSCPLSLPPRKPRKTAAAPLHPRALYARARETNDSDPPTRAPAHVPAKQLCRGGAAAVAAIRAILAEPGPCALDFESYPTDPGWHGDAAAAAAPKGKKGVARDQGRRIAELNGRAHLRQPCVLSLAHANGAEVVVRLDDGDDPGGRRAELQAMFATPRARLVAHRAQFEVEILLQHGVALDVDCTWLMAKALLLIAFDPEKQAPPVEFGLAALVEREFGRARDKQPRNRDWRLEESLDEEGVSYCRQDAHDAVELFQLYRARLEAEGLYDGYRLIQQAILPTAALNLVGMKFDAAAHRALTSHLRNRAARLERILDEICGGAVRNHGSSPQVSNWVVEQVLDGDYADDPNRIGNFVARLCARTGVTWKQTKNKHLSITKGIKARQARALEPYYPTIARYLRAHALHTQVIKLADSFGEPLERWIDVDGRLRGQMTAGATVTLRHNAQHPPVQEMPRRKAFRRLFKAPAGRRLIDCDFSQIELRLAAIEARDEALLEVYRRGLDVHADVAGNINLPRSQAKPVSFTMIYYGGAAKVAEAAGVSLERGQEVLEAFLSAYPGIARYREQAPLEAQQNGFIAIRPGRRVHYDPTISKPAQAVNYPIQGGAASVQMLALRKVYDALEAQPWLDARVVASVHDELILEAPDDERAGIAASILQHEMRSALLEVFPEAVAMGADRLAEAEVLTSWAEKG